MKIPAIKNVLSYRPKKAKKQSRATRRNSLSSFFAMTQDSSATQPDDGSASQDPTLITKTTTVESDDFTCTSAPSQVETSAGGTVVKFDESQNAYHDHPHNDLSEEEWEQLWYSSQECHRMKADNLQTCQTICRLDPASATCCSEQELEETPPSASSYLQTLQLVYDSCCNAQQPELSSALRDELQQQVALYWTRVGLERPLIKSVAARDKQMRRKQLEDVVFNLRYDVPPTLTPEEFSQLLCQKCTAISRPSRLFAACIGQANLQESL